MSKHIEIFISEKLSDVEWGVLEAFCEKATRLIATKMVGSEENSLQGRIRYEQNRGLWFEAEIPSEEVIAEFLMVFRFFYLQKERTHFPKVLNILSKHAEIPEVIAHYRRLKKRWEDGLFEKALYIKLNEETMTASLLLDLWFNAHYFHSDEEKSKRLEGLNEAFSKKFSKYMMLDGAFEAAKAAFIIYNSIKEMVENRA